MSGRPEALFPLFATLTTLPGIGTSMAARFRRLGIETPRDLLFTLPAGVIDRRRRASILGVPLPATLTVEVVVERHHPPPRKGPPYRVTVRDAQTTFQVVFFRPHEARIASDLPPGARRILSGRVEIYDGMAQMAHPDHILTPQEADTLGAFEPHYPLTAGLTQRHVSRAVSATLELAPRLDEWIDPTLVAREGWPGWRDALREAHAPASEAALAAESPARRRLAYDEFFAHQLTLALARARQRRKRGRPTLGDGARRRVVIEALPYTPTSAQLRAIAEIDADMASHRRMMRLLQGDVGAGKTLVAALALVTAVEAGGQGALMAPTEILARQHLASLEPLLAPAGIRVAALTGRDRSGRRKEILSGVAEKRIDVLIGTHALIQAEVAFADLRLAVVDEQHRFGVDERMRLGAKGEAVDVLVMTATPIPRSLALSQFGDMEVSILDEKPPGRQRVNTALLSTRRLDEVVERLRHALSQGQRAYWVCPLVEESEVSDLVAAEDRAAHLRAALGAEVVGLVHGQMPLEQRDAAMAAFVAGETRVLVATTVIEVGVDVPEATIIVIERAEWFGLAQLHQLRGRVGRGRAASACLLLYRPPLSETERRRLEILRETDDGFRIAAEDLMIRGAGDLLGTAQSGLPRFRIASLERQAALMATAQVDARLLVDRDPALDTARGQAARTLLYLLSQDDGIRLLSIG